MRRWITIGLIALLLLCTTVSASEVYLETSNGHYFISLKLDQNTVPGSFFVQMNYSNEISVKSIEGNSLFTVFSDIQNGDGYTNLAGVAMKKAEPDINFRLAEIVFEGAPQFEIIVWELYDYDLNPIKVTNICPEVTAEPTSEPTPVPTSTQTPTPTSTTSYHSGSGGGGGGGGGPSYFITPRVTETKTPVPDNKTTEDYDNKTAIITKKNETENNSLNFQLVAGNPAKEVPTVHPSKKTSSICSYSVLLSLLFAMYFIGGRRR